MRNTNNNLTTKQLNILDRLKQILPFVADLAHGHVAIYIQTETVDKLRITATATPHTVYMQDDAEMAEGIVDSLSEPLVTEVFQSAQFVHGKREQDYGHFVDMYVFPIVDGTNAIAVISIEVDKEHLNIDDLLHIYAFF